MELTLHVVSMANWGTFGSKDTNEEIGNYNLFQGSVWGIFEASPLLTISLSKLSSLHWNV